MADFIWEDSVCFRFSFETNLLHKDSMRHDALNHKYATYVYADDTDMFVKTNGGWVLGTNPMAALRRTIVSKMISTLQGLDSSKREEEGLDYLNYLKTRHSLHTTSTTSNEESEIGVI
jgi:hypothetical protein